MFRWTVALLFSIHLVYAQELPDDHGELESNVICTAYHISKNWDDIDTLKNDKLKHCTASCISALKCSKKEARAVGYLKEFLDSLGLGTPDRDDIKANEAGIQLSRVAFTIGGCFKGCDFIY